MSEALTISIFITAHDMASRVLSSLGAEMGTLHGLMMASAVGIGAGLAVAAGAAIKFATDFDQQMARIGGLTDTSAQQLEYYKQKLLELSPQLDLTATDAAKALYFIISAGFKGQQALDILTYSAKSATASLADQGQVADAMTSMMNAYKDANLNAATAANLLTKIEVYGKAQLQAFASSLGFTMVTAHAAGLSVYETAAAISTLSQVSGSHGIRRISMEFDNLARSMLDINAVQKRVQQQLGRGFHFDAAAFAADSFIDKLKYLAQISGGLNHSFDETRLKQIMATAATMNDADAQKYLALQLAQGNSRFLHIVGGAAAFIPALILLTHHADMYSYILGKMKDKQDLVQHAFDTMRQSTAQQWKMLEIGTQNILIIFGLKLLPIINQILQALIHLTRGIMAFIQTKEGMEQVKWAVMGIVVAVGSFLLPSIVGLVAAAMPFLAAMAAWIAAGILIGKILSSHPEIINRVKQALAGLMDVVGKVTGIFHTLGDMISGSTQSAAITAEQHATQMRLKVIDQTLHMQRDAVQSLRGQTEGILLQMTLTHNEAQRHALQMRLDVINHLMVLRQKSVVEAEKMRAGVLSHLRTMSAQSKPALGPFQQALASLGGAAQSLMPVIGMLAQFIGTVLGTALRIAVPIIGGAAIALASIATIAGHVISGIAQLTLWVRNNEIAFTALKAILVAIGIAMGVNMVEDLTMMAGRLLWLIPILWGQAAAWWATASAMIVAELPIYLLVAAIAALVFGIMMLVQHWTQVRAFFANIAAAAGSFFSWLGSHVHAALDKVGQFFQAGFDKLEQIVHWFTTLTPQKIAYMVGYAIGFLIGLPIRAAILLWQFVTMVRAFLGHLAQEAPVFIVLMITRILLWLEQMKTQAEIKILAFVTLAFATLIHLAQQAPTYIVLMITRILLWFVHLRDQARLKLIEMVTAVLSELQKLPTQALVVATNFIAGLINGIKNGAGAVVDALKNLANGMLNGFRQALGIHSPSAVMFQHGVNLIQGLINGFRSIDVRAEWMRHIGVLAPAAVGMPALASAGSLPWNAGEAGGRFGGLRLMQGNGGNVTHNWTLNFPNARDHTEIKRAIIESQQEVYRRSRRPGGYGGFGSDFSIDS